MLYQPQDGTAAPPNVVAFAPRPPSVGLSLRDRMEIGTWQEQLRRFGYDRMVIHERISCDPPEVECFLSIYRHGEAWARWGLARCGGAILAWCSVTGRDIGRFPSVRDALAALFPLSPGGAETAVGAEIIRLC